MSNELQNFAASRLKGAKQIATDSKAKGGNSLLTYDHYRVKLPYYEQASQGLLNIDEAKAIYRDCIFELYINDNLSQQDFQRLVGKIEVLGELIIQSK